MSRSPSRCSAAEFASPPLSAGLTGGPSGIDRPRQYTFGSPVVSLDGPTGQSGPAGESLPVPSASSSRRPSVSVSMTNVLPQLIGRTTVLEASRKAFLHVRFCVRVKFKLYLVRL